MKLLLGIVHNAADDVSTLVNAQNTGIQGNVIVLRLAPGTAGIVLVIDAAALILFVKTLLRRLVRLTVTANNALCTVGFVGKYVDMQGILTILQDVVGIPADNNTGPLLCQLQDDAALNVPQEIGSGQTVHNAGNTLRCKGIGEQAAAGRMLTMLFHKLRSEAGFHSDLINQFLVIEGDTQSFCYHTSDGTTTRTQLAADGNDFLFHKMCLLLIERCRCLLLIL